ncbi:hypothetical protein L2X99_15480 [Microbacterium sp. KUDC0406]|nr:hypothetical protein [Microbacterium sp. KUDC0406]UJP11770.1 hypothetical protein L2X99_15480 [Microbacterium sp. KUDC0406]
MAASAIASIAASRSEYSSASRQAGSRSSFCCVMPAARASRACRSRQNGHPFSCDARTLMYSVSAGESPALAAASAIVVDMAAAAFQTSGEVLSR